MSQTIELQQIGTWRLNNGEYAALMDKTRMLITSSTPEKLNIDEDTLMQFDENLYRLTDLLIRVRSRSQTAQMREFDKKRNNLFKYILAASRNALLSPSAGHPEAGTKLWLLLKPVKELAKLPYQQKTEVIEAVLFDLNKPEYATHINILRLDEAVAELTSANKNYNKLSISRTEKRAADTMTSGRIIRSRIDKLCYRIRSLAFAAYISSPSTETESFVTGYNQLVSEIKLAYKLRMAHRKRFAQ